MNKVLALLIVIALAAGGFYWYINSGEVLDEAAPAVTENIPVKKEMFIGPDSPNSDRLMVKELMEEIIPDKPEKEAPLEEETVKEVAQMITDAQVKRDTMPTEEKIEMEKKTTMMMNPEMEVPDEAEEPETITPPAPEMPAEEMKKEGITRMGAFNAIDTIHKGSGKAIVYPNTAEGPILRLENFDVTRGPDLHVYLSRNTNITSADQLGSYHDLGRLKSSKGNQNYALPSNHAGFKSVVIWCQAFGVLFSSATLQP